MCAPASEADAVLYGNLKPSARQLIAPRPQMTSTGPSSPVAHYVCPDCGSVFKLPSTGDIDQRPWCTHASNYSWQAPTHPEIGWTQMEYAEVRIGVPHSNGEAWNDPLIAAVDEEDFEDAEFF